MMHLLDYSRYTFPFPPRGCFFSLLHLGLLIILDNFIVIMFSPSPLASLPLALRFTLCSGHPERHRHIAL